VIAYCAVTAILAAPFVDYAHLASACYDGDAYLVLWTLAWDSHAIMNRLPLFDANMFYPAAHALAYNEHLFGLSLFYLPLYPCTRGLVAGSHRWGGRIRGGSGASERCSLDTPRSRCPWSAPR
jgi:hypothetical protein